ncbi:MAG: hypothetical protein IK086_07805, partial [Clostridia bacterium]|nr:hypothetical protein [Clostridia bacterium]
YISAAGELILDNLKLARNFTDFAAAGRYALRQAARRLPQKRGETGGEFVRFLGGVTPKGVIGFSKTVTDFYNDIVVISDKRGAASGEIMRALRAAAISRGYDIITVKNPFLPSELIDHILIPGLSLAFVTENDYITFDTPVRRVHARRFTDENALKKYKSRTIFNRRVSKELLSGAVLALKGAKDVHDTLESYYIRAMDFAALTEFITEKTGEILK